MKLTRLCNGKAIAVEEENAIWLQSYDTKVAKIENGKCVLMNEDMISSTTIRHIHEFCRWFNVKSPEMHIKYRGAY